MLVDLPSGGTAAPIAFAASCASSKLALLRSDNAGIKSRFGAVVTAFGRENSIGGAFGGASAPVNIMLIIAMIGGITAIFIRSPLRSVPLGTEISAETQK